MRTLTEKERIWLVGVVTQYSNGDEGVEWGYSDILTITALAIDRGRKEERERDVAILDKLHSHLMQSMTIPENRALVDTFLTELRRRISEGA